MKLVLGLANTLDWGELELSLGRSGAWYGKPWGSRGGEEVSLGMACKGIILNDDEIIVLRMRVQRELLIVRLHRQHGHFIASVREVVGCCTFLGSGK